MSYSGFWSYLLIGAMASGRSGMRNGALDTVREVNRQKQILTEHLKSGFEAPSPKAAISSAP